MKFPPLACDRLQRVKPVAILAVLAVATSIACTTVRTSGHSQPIDEPPPLLGLVDRLEVETYSPEWVDELVQAEPDPTEAARLAGSGAGCEVVVYLGTWCSDSRRELARLWRALDLAGGGGLFEVSYVGVDREKREPAELLAGIELDYVPTIVVRREGRELGRIVESSPIAIETDLADLLSGVQVGVLSGRDDLGETDGDDG